MPRMGSEAAAWLATQSQEIDEALGELVRLNSFTENAAGGRAVGQRLLARFAMEGLAAELVPSATYADHLVFRSVGRGDQAPIALLGHVDTVFPPGVFEGYVTDGPRRRGPGVYDMKGGLVAMAWGLKAVAKTVGLDAVPPLRVVIVSDEEVGSPEGAPLIRRVIAGAQACLVFEPGRSNDAVVTQRKGTGTVRVVATGVAAHAGNSYWQGANAIWSLSRFVDAAQRLSSQETGVTVNVGTISGGTTKNTVPAAAWAGVDLRYGTAREGEALVERLRQLAGEVALPGTSLAIELGPNRAPMERTPATEALAASYARVATPAGLGAGEAPLQSGGSDGNTAAALGIPTIDALGPRGGGFHTVGEFIDFDTVLARATALADLLTALSAGARSAAG
ncbi:MAG: M20/M25/M40 family metallo-hydrolase [Archangium sp.]|nr:M20/M25/M40 family metallo-hydrolase [Archangium sp.]